eukprot:TRINITY_DN5771_c0_g1_i1.p2 TRINITY_DN5771_c0_g1~~TRINITY_DN5771_c0_g1_i1.p2  ORF type:complete len:128 (+),score=10.07 TRINITY_DN5771_c0_g1_i1:84-467(+)
MLVNKYKAITAGRSTQRPSGYVTCGDATCPANAPRSFQPVNIQRIRGKKVPNSVLPSLLKIADGFKCGRPHTMKITDGRRAVPTKNVEHLTSRSIPTNWIRVTTTTVRRASRVGKPLLSGHELSCFM